MSEFRIDGQEFKKKDTPRYDLSPEEESLLTEGLLKDRLPEQLDRDSRFVTIEVGGLSDYANIGRRIELDVFSEVAGAYNEQMIEQYAKYESSSRFFLSIDANIKKAVGVLRVIRNSPNGVKTLNDAQKEPFFVGIDDVKIMHNIADLDSVWDVGTVAVDPEYRGPDSGLVSIQLYRALYLSSVRNNIDHWVSIIDHKLFRVLTGLFGMPFVPLADSEPGPYLGTEKSHPVYAHVPEFYDKMVDKMASVNSATAKNIMGRLINGQDDTSIFSD